MPSSWVIRSRLKRDMSSTMTVRVPLASTASSRAANPGRLSIGSVPDTAASLNSATI
jgi:hypothetical protein